MTPGRGSSRAELEALAARLFTSLREADYAAAAACFAPDATWWMNSGLRGRAADVFPRLQAANRSVGHHTHEEVRRLFCADGLVEQHVARWRGPAGEPREVAVCAVVRVGSDGLVTRFEEYYDTAALQAPSLQPGTLTTIDRVAEHVRAEYGNDVPEILATISTWDVHYALLAPAADGLRLELVEDVEGASRYYAATRQAYRVVTSHHLKELNSPWYSFHESVGVLVYLGEGDAAGSEIHVPTAVLFPTRPDGIIGEVGWARFDIAEIAGGAVRPGRAPAARAPHLPAAQLRNAELHDRFLEGWQAGDVEAVVALLDDRCCSVLRTAAVAGEERARHVARGKDEHRRLLGSAAAIGPAELRVTNLLVGDWYVFAEYLIPGRRDRLAVNRRLAALYPVSEEGRLVGQLAYGLDEVEP